MDKKKCKKGDTHCLSEYRKSILPEYNLDKKIIKLDGFVDKIRELDPQKEYDQTLYKYGDRFEVKVGYPESLGEHGNWTEFHYPKKPTPEDIAADLKAEYAEFILDNPDGPMLSGREENIKKAIRKALGK